MPEPPGDRAASTSPRNGKGAAAYAELRRLLLGEEIKQIAGLEKRLDDPAVRASETGKILPGAIKAAQGRGMRDALEPFIEKSFHSSVRKNPREIADAIYPIIGPAIRKSITAAIREFQESLNQIVEKSASWRALRWRMEAVATGRPFTEILLARSLMYSVEQVFLIHRESGILLLHVAAEHAVVKDADMVSGMLTAIGDFVTDSFTGSGNQLETVEVVGYKLWVQYGSKALLVGAVSGTAPVELKGVFRNALERIHEEFFVPLDTFKQEDVSPFESARPILESCLLGHRPPQQRRRIVPALAVAAVAVVLLLGALVFFQLRSQRRWDAYVDALRAQPGIAVLRAERSGSGGVIAGLKDPEAPDPVDLLASFSIDKSKVRFEWQPFLSLNTPFAAKRDSDAEIARIQSHTVRFEVGSRLLPLAEAARLDAVAASIQRLRQTRPNLRLTITGHTDEVGSAESNVKLSQDRAAVVAAALAAQGIPADSMSITGKGNSEPVRNGASEWDRAANRSVSFRLDPGNR